MRPMLAISPNQSAPSGPEVMSSNGGPPKLTGGTGYSVMTPAMVIRPILSTFDSVNQSAPSDPAVMPKAPLEGVGMGYCVKDCAQPAWVKAHNPIKRRQTGLTG